MMQYCCALVRSSTSLSHVLDCPKHAHKLEVAWLYYNLHHHRQWNRAISKGMKLDYGIHFFYSVTNTEHLSKVRDHIHLSCKYLTEVVFRIFYCIKIA